MVAYRETGRRGNGPPARQPGARARRVRCHAKFLSTFPLLLTTLPLATVPGAGAAQQAQYIPCRADARRWPTRNLPCVLRHKRRAQDQRWNWLIAGIKTGRTRTMGARCRRHQALAERGCRTASAPVVKRAYRRRQIAVLRVDQRQGRSEAACSRRATRAPLCEIRLRRDGWRCGSGPALNAGTGYRHRYRRPPASPACTGSACRRHRGKSQSMGPPGTVVPGSPPPELLSSPVRRCSAAGRGPEAETGEARTIQR